MTKKILRKASTGESGNKGEFGTHDHSTPEASLDGSTLKSFNRRTGNRDIEHKVLFTTTGGQYVVVDDRTFGKHVEPYAVYHVGTGLRVPIERNPSGFHRQNVNKEFAQAFDDQGFFTADTGKPIGSAGIIRAWVRDWVPASA